MKVILNILLLSTCQIAQAQTKPEAKQRFELPSKLKASIYTHRDTIPVYNPKEFILYTPVFDPSQNYAFKMPVVLDEEKTLSLSDSLTLNSEWQKKFSEYLKEGSGFSSPERKKE